MISLVWGACHVSASGIIGDEWALDLIAKMIDKFLQYIGGSGATQILICALIIGSVFDGVAVYSGEDIPSRSVDHVAVGGVLHIRHRAEATG